MSKIACLILFLVCLQIGVNGGPLPVDLSHTYKDGMPAYYGFVKFTMHPTVGGAGSTKFRSESIETETHVGTHMDAPRQFNETGIGIDEFLPQELVADAIVIDIREQAKKDPSYRVTLDDLTDWKKTHGAIPEGCVVLILSGWDQKWRNATEYYGSDDPKQYKWPGMSVNATRWLIDEKKVIGFGIDTAALDAAPVDTDTFPNHPIVQSGRRYIMENMVNLALLPPRGIKLYSFPLKIENATAAPTRVVAFL